MRNHANNFIPIPIKPSKTTPRALPRLSTQRKTSSSQTERVVLIKEENLTFFPCTRIGQNDGGMRRDYVKAVNYINSCHKFINAVIEKKSESKPDFLLPMATNYIPIFPHLMGKRPSKQKDRPPERAPDKKPPKSKSSFGVKTLPQEAPIDPLPVGDCGRAAPETRDISNIVKDEVQKFLLNLQEDMTNAMRKTKSEIPKQKCKNLTIVKQRLEELSKICFLQKHIDNNPQVLRMELALPPPPSPPPISLSADCSVIQSDTDCEEAKKVHSGDGTHCEESICSLVSDSSDIQSDSELELLFDC